MKQTLFIIIALLCITHSKAQELVLPQGGKVTLQQKEEDATKAIAIRADFPDPSKKLKIRIIDVDTSTAALGVDYKYEGDITQPYVLEANSPQLDIKVNVTGSKDAGEAKVFRMAFIKEMSCSSDTQQLEVTIVPSNEKKKPIVFQDTAKWFVDIVTGSNFDFFDDASFKNFAGDVTIFLPDLFQVAKTTAKADKRRADAKKKDKSEKRFSLGLLAGFFNYRYFDVDSSGAYLHTEDYLADPTLRDAQAGDAYYHEQYTLRSTKNFNTVGAYLNPMITLSQNDFAQLYANLHCEVLWRTQITRNEKELKSQILDTLQASDLVQSRIRRYPRHRAGYTKETFTDLYLGIGFPVRVNIKNAFSFFVSPTIGGVFYEKTKPYSTATGNLVTDLSPNETIFSPFTLTKVQLKTEIAAVDLCLGGEFRHVWRDRCYYAVYLGAAISLDQLKK